MNDDPQPQSDECEPQEQEDELTPELEADIKRFVAHHFGEHYR